jgi:alpha-tubulin suppressor-like RCC1 family protein
MSKNFSRKKAFCSVLLSIICAGSLFSLSGCSDPKQSSSDNDTENKTEMLTFMDKKTIAAAGFNVLAIKSDGSLLNTPIIKIAGDTGDNVSLGWTDLAEVDCGGDYLGEYTMVGLKNDGTVVAVGGWFDEPKYKKYVDISKWENITSISAGESSQLMGLRKDGCVEGVPEIVDKAVSSWTEIVDIACGYSCYVGVDKNGRVHYSGNNKDTYNASECDKWENITSVAIGEKHIVGLSYDGTVIATGNNDYGQCDVSDWKNIVSVSAVGNTTVGLKKDGTVVAVGDNRNGLCDVSDWKNIISIETSAANTIGLKQNGELVCTTKDEKTAKEITSWNNLKIK